MSKDHMTSIQAPTSIQKAVLAIHKGVAPIRCTHCSTSGQMMAFKNGTEVMECEGLKREISNLSGWECLSCSKVEFDVASMHHYVSFKEQLELDARNARPASYVVGKHNFFKGLTYRINKRDIYQLQDRGEVFTALKDFTVDYDDREALSPTGLVKLQDQGKLTVTPFGVVFID